MNQIPCASENTEVKILSADVCVFGRFGRLSPATVHSADSRFDSRVKCWDHVSSIVTYLRPNSFYSFKTVGNNALNRRRVVVFDWQWANTAPTLNITFSSTNVHAKWWIHFLLLSSTPLLSHATSIYDRPKRFCWVFWCFPKQLLHLGYLSVKHLLCLYDCVPS